MPPRVPEIPVRWLSGVLLAALGVSGGCTDRLLEGEDVTIADDESDGVDTSADGTTEPFECPEANVVVAGTLDPETGMCEPCGDACMEALEAEKQSLNLWCDGSCWCDTTTLCTPTYPTDEGECLHGFLVEEWCGEGRPLIADGEARVAPTCERGDWIEAAPVWHVEPTTRARALDGWLARAAMEHASVAAFARFAMQLQALGAPAELIADAHVAALDELRHARLCFAVASRLDGRRLGPGPLALDGLDLRADPASVAVETILEGCIGETVAAAKMRYLADAASDPDLRRLLRAIADDEARHAALAWRALGWLLDRFDLRDVVRRTFAGALADALTTADRRPPTADPLVGDGVLDSATSDWITRAVLREVVAPAFAALVEGPAASMCRAPRPSRT